MINKQMNEKKENEKKPTQDGIKPNETGGFYFSSSVKIFDPNSQEIILHTRGDN